jgi:hypothetical protein
MISNELIADKIEEVIGRMFTEFRNVEPNASEYSLFHDSKKHTSWFILIFFADIYQLKEGLKNGICFQIHSFLLGELEKINEISDVGRVIFFESGNRPIEKNDIDILFGNLLKKIAGLQKTANKTDIKICGICGHDFDKHQMLFNNESGKVDMTTVGWMICPEENCNCFQTWNTNLKPDYDLKDENKENGFKRLIKKMFN